MTDAVAVTGDEAGARTLAPLQGAAIAAVLTALLFFDTSASMVSTWHRSETFTHGFFVLPVFLWLIWRDRALLVGVSAAPERRALPLMGAAGALWLVSRVADVLAGQQLALVLMLVFVIIAFAGLDIARRLHFPLLFLLFLAPLGEELVPVLMDVTADLTVGAIGLTGIPIYREGLFFSLPSGDWSVVEACSGIRYLIASIVLGSLYAHLYIDGTSRKLAFLVLAAVVPIVANGIRAFLIVMIGHFSSMKLATGADHLVYGWLFFGIVMFMLFSVGSLFRRDERRDDGEVSVLDRLAGARSFAAEGTRARDTNDDGNRRLATHAALVASVVAIWPLWASAVDHRATRVTLSNEQVATALPHADTVSDAIDTEVTAWRPTIAGHDALRQSVIENDSGGPAVFASAYLYATQRQGKEMVASNNMLVPSQDPDWRRVATDTIELDIEDGTRALAIEQSVLSSARGELLVWRWYRVGDKATAAGARAKVHETVNRLLLRAEPSVAYVLAVDGRNRELAHDALMAALARVIAVAGNQRDSERNVEAKL